MPDFPNDPVSATSASKGKPALQGEGGDNEGVRGICHNAHGGVVGINDWGGDGSPGSGGNGGWFESSQGEGVRGWSKNPNHGGVVGVNTASGIAVFGTCDDGTGVVGESKNGRGVFGESANSEGVRGVSHSSHGAVVGVNDWPGDGTPGSGGNGGWFESTQGEGVRGISKNPNHGGVVGVNTAGGQAVFGSSDNGTGVVGESKQSNGVLGISHHPVNAAISAVNVAGGFGLWAESQGGNNKAAHFNGNVEIAGDLTILNGKDIRLADFAEDFDVSGEEEIGPGSVVVLDDEGSVRQSETAYDKKVAGVIAGAGDFRSAITLDRQPSADRRAPVALMGKVYCKVDAQYAAIKIGDLLTTSPTQGHAMKAVEPARAFGAVIGKALQPLAAGLGEIAILIALQ